MSSLFFLLIGCGAGEIHGCGSSSAGTPKLATLEQAATEQLNARRGAEHALVEAQSRIAQLDQALQQGARPSTAVGQVLGTRVLGREGVAKLELRDDRLRGSHRPAAVGGHDKCRDQYGCVEQRRHGASQAVQERSCSSSWSCCALAEPWIALPMLRMAGAWRRMLFQAYSPKNNARLVATMLEVLAFPLDSNDVVNSSETTERKIKELKRCANVEVPEFLKIGIAIRQAGGGPMRTHFIMNSQRLTTFQDIKTEVTNVKQAPNAVMAKTCSKGSSKGASKGAGNGKDSEVMCWYCEKKDIQLPIAASNRRTSTKGQSKGSKKGDSKGKGNKKDFKGMCHKCCQTWSYVEGLQIQRND